MRLSLSSGLEKVKDLACGYFVGTFRLTPVNGTGHYIPAAVGIGNIVASAFRKINLTAGWPCPVDIIGRHHPCSKLGKLSLSQTKTGMG